MTPVAEEPRLREAAELMCRTAAVHRVRAAGLTVPADPGGEFQVRLERGPAKVAAEHAMAYREQRGTGRRGPGGTANCRSARCCTTSADAG
ncbi:hypothetical protein [Amycolatopsis sp. NPDC051371]|uniref:hypothetical protein n=1 Tax=Amycolatopsis sp. NPDC051371 TaxID=3155800 RepID=UPI003441FC89